MVDRPTLTLTEAAKAAGVARVTIRRRLDDHAFPGAVLDESGATPTWRIPVEDLLAAGFTLHAPAPPDAPVLAPVAVDVPGRADLAPAGPEPGALAALRAELADVRSVLAAEQRRAAAAEARAALAEAVAAERAASLDLLRLALHALPPAPDTPRRRRRWRRNPSPPQTSV